MRTPLQAMLWELWRTSRFELLMRIAGQSGLVLLIYSVAGEFSETQIQVVRGIVIMLLTITSVFSLTWMNELESESWKSGFSFRLGFARPISTSWLVVVPMLFSVIAAVVCFLLPALFFSLIFRASMPLAGVTAMIAVMVACLVSSTWSLTTTVGKSIAMSAVLTAAAVAFAAFHRWRDDPDPILLAIGKPGYFDLPWHVYTACLAVSVLAFIVTMIAVDRQRHGDRWELARRWTRYRRTDSPGAVASTQNARVLAEATALAPAKLPFRSPFFAQFWYEMRRFGNNLLLLGAMFSLIVFVLLNAVLRFEPDWEGVPTVSIFALIVCPFVSQLFGADGAVGLKRKQGAVRFSAFDATCPMPNDQLIAIKLLVIAACSLVGWLCMGFAVALQTAIADNWQIWARIGESVSAAAGDVPVYWWFAGLANAALMYISSSSIFLALGLWLPLYKKRFVLLLVALYLQIMLATWDAANGWHFWYLWLAEGYVISVAIVTGCVFAVRKALLAGYLGKRLFGCAFCLWLIYVLSTVAFYVKLAPKFSIPLVVIVLGISLLLVPLAATAIAPLALASHRHA